MATTLHWHQHPGRAVRWALLLAVLAAHAGLLWFWPVSRPQAVLERITPVRVVMVDEGAAPRPLVRAATEAPPQRPAAARQVANAMAPQDLRASSPRNAPAAAQPAAPSNAPAPPAAPSTQANLAPAKPPGGESSATNAAAVSATDAASGTGARVDGPANSAQASSALPAPGLGTVAAAPGAPKTMKDICPHTVKAVPPARATQAGLGGMVLARATILGGKVRRVDILKSEPGGLYDAAVRTAMAQYVCRDQGALEVLAEQLFEFKVVE